MKKDLIEYEQYSRGGYNITYDPQFINNKYEITKELIEKVEELFYEIQDDPDFNTINTLKSLIKQFPDYPVLKNYLSIAYENSEQDDLFGEINLQIVEQHPDYLFGKLNLATRYLLNDNLKDSLKIIGETLSLKDLYPERNLFHVSEILGYLRFTVLYNLKIGEIEEAKAIFEEMKSIEPDHFEIKNVATILMLNGLTPNLETSTTIMAESDQLALAVQLENLPKFNHQEISYLYTNGLSIEHELLEEILSLPRETLIEDLEAMLKDAKDRYEYFGEFEYNTDTHDFVLHALFLFMELKAEKSLPTILDFLKGDEEFLEYWLGEHITHMVWQVVYQLSYHNPEALEVVIKDHNFYTFIKSAVSESLLQIALHNEDKHKQVSEIYKNTLIFYNEGSIDEDLIDSTFLGLLIGNIIDLNLQELLPLIKDLYSKYYVDFSINGSIVEVEKDFGREAAFHHKEIKSIFEVYDEYSTFTGNEDIMSSFDDWNFPYKQLEPIIAEPKIGRNEPCPCGSGKKYKKCCLKD